MGIFSNKKKELKREVEELQTRLKITTDEMNEMHKAFSVFYELEPKINVYMLRSVNGEIQKGYGGYKNVLGYSKRELCCMRLSSITHADDFKAFQNELIKHLKFEGTLRRKCINNTYKWVQVSARIVKSDTSIMLLEYDIDSYNKQVKNNFNVLLNALPDMAYIKDGKSRFMMVNSKFASACQQDVQFFHNRSAYALWKSNPLFKAMHTLDSSMATKYTDEAIEVSQLYEYEWPDGIVRNIDIHRYNLESMSKDFQREYTHPLTLHILKAEHSSQKGTNGAHFRCSYNTQSEEFLITYTSKEYESIMNHEPRHSELASFVHKDDVYMFKYSLYQMSKSLHPWRWQGRLQFNEKKTEKKVNVIAWPVKSAESVEMLGIIQDLTQQNWEKKFNTIMMRYLNDFVGFHTFDEQGHPFTEQFTHSIESLLGYHSSEIKQQFWLLHPDDCDIMKKTIVKLKRGISETVIYRIKHKENHWVKVETLFIPFDEGFVSISKRMNSQSQPN